MTTPRRGQGGPHWDSGTIQSMFALLVRPPPDTCVAGSNLQTKPLQSGRNCKRKREDSLGEPCQLVAPSDDTCEVPIWRSECDLRVRSVMGGPIHRGPTRCQVVPVDTATSPRVANGGGGVLRPNEPAILTYSLGNDRASDSAPRASLPQPC